MRTKYYSEYKHFISDSNVVQYEGLEEEVYENLIFLGDYNLRGSISEVKNSVTEEDIRLVEVHGIKNPLKVFKLRTLNQETGKRMYLVINGNRRGYMVKKLIDQGKKIGNVVASEYKIPLLCVSGFLGELDFLQYVDNKHVEYSPESLIRFLTLKRKQGAKVKDLASLTGLTSARISQLLKIDVEDEEVAEALKYYPVTTVEQILKGSTQQGVGVSDFISNVLKDKGKITSSSVKDYLSTPTKSKSFISFIEGLDIPKEKITLILYEYRKNH